MSGTERLVLMCRSEKVENHLHRIERSKRNFNEKSVPVAHSTVPQSRKLECLEFTSLIALGADESRILIHIFEKVEALTLVIVETAYDIHRIEVSSRCKCIAGVIVRQIGRAHV